MTGINLPLNIETTGFVGGANRAKRVLIEVGDGARTTERSLYSVERAMGQVFQASANMLTMGANVNRAADAFKTMNVAAGAFSAAFIVQEASRIATAYKNIQVVTTATTVALDGTRAVVSSSATGFSKLWTVIKGHPLLSIAAVIGTVATAIDLMTDKVVESSEAYKTLGKSIKDSVADQAVAKMFNMPERGVAAQKAQVDSLFQAASAAKARNWYEPTPMAEFQASLKGLPGGDPANVRRLVSQSYADKLSSLGPDQGQLGWGSRNYGIWDQQRQYRAAAGSGVVLPEQQLAVLKEISSKLNVYVNPANVKDGIFPGRANFTDNFNLRYEMPQAFNGVRIGEDQQALINLSNMDDRAKQNAAFMFPGENSPRPYQYLRDQYSLRYDTYSPPFNGVSMSADRIAAQTSSNLYDRAMRSPLYIPDGIYPGRAQFTDDFALKNVSSKPGFNGVRVSEDQKYLMDADDTRAMQKAFDEMEASSQRMGQYFGQIATSLITGADSLKDAARQVFTDLIRLGATQGFASIGKGFMSGFGSTPTQLKA